MQIKTIERIIKNKLTDWLETIDNEPLRDKVRDNILVSGGSIASMLLREKVNDYDVYIKDVSVLKELAIYYTKGYQDIEILDGREKSKYCDSNGYCNDEGNNQYAVSVDNLKEDQIKLYFTDEDKGGKLVNQHIPEEEREYDVMYFSPNAISLSNDLQIVVRFNGDNEKIHKTFDFVHATNYYTFKNGLVTNKSALESLITKQLRYQGSMYPLTSIIRMKKFILRGWNISAGEILKIMFQISELDLKDMNVLEEQLIGVDVAYFSSLVQILRGVDSEKLSSSYINKIIDKVFNSIDNEIDS